MRQQGVTLIQMMCALAVAGLLTHLGISAYSKVNEELYQSATARELVQALRDARNQALLRQQAVLVLPVEGDWGKGWRLSLEHDGQLLREHRLGRPIWIVASDPREMRFSGRGAPLGSGFGGITLHICQRNTGASLYQVVLSPSGRIRLLNDEKRRCAGD
ncbi:GspH/FimT family pseudopilin [Pseudomonas sichuanensis]|uniref:GspH/FimT family pseudopilin n=1 Tax=Pseudomonas sichuanensis TaxID=2213015 RepID=UPI000DA6DAB8|nr:GspH/FimT family protein [Pseudomonas sichuanensis]